MPVMDPPEMADALVDLAKRIRKAGRAGPNPSPHKAATALAGFASAATDLVEVQRSLADTRDSLAVVAIPEGWGKAAALAEELGVTPQTVSKWRKRGERLAAGAKD